MLDPYETLKVSPDAPDAVIRAAYKALASKYHPDKHQSDSAAARMMQQINDAYALLSDPTKRSAYDASLKSRKAIINCRHCSCALRVDIEALNKPDNFTIICPACQKHPLEKPSRNSNEPHAKGFSTINCRHCGSIVKLNISKPRKLDSRNLKCPTCGRDPVIFNDSRTDGSRTHQQPDNTRSPTQRKQFNIIFVTAIVIGTLYTLPLISEIYSNKNNGSNDRPVLEHKGAPDSPYSNEDLSNLRNPPLESGGAETRTKLNIAEKNMAEAEVEINQVWRALPKSIRDGLLSEQRAFNKNKETKCAARSSSVADDNLRKITRLNCWEDEYRQRTVVLKSAASNAPVTPVQSPDSSNDHLYEFQRKEQLELEINRVWRSLPKDIRNANLEAQRQFNRSKEELCKARAGSSTNKELIEADCWSEQYARRIPELLALSATSDQAFQPNEYCPSRVSLNIESSNYHGLIHIELRKGMRPGSKVIRTKSVNTRGAVVMHGVCRGTYFFAFSTPDTDQVSVTRYFDIATSETSYNNPTITVTYSRLTSNSDRVGSAKRSDL